MKLLFGDFLPDLTEYGAPGVSEAVNVYPSSTGFRPVGQFEAHTTGFPGLCRGASAFIAPSGRVVLIAGTSTTLYRQTLTGWEVIGTGYTMPTGTRWRFCQFGPFAIATNASDPMVKINLETDVVTPLGGTPPKFQALATVNNFVVGTQRDGVVNRIAWSGENDAEWWTPAQRKSDYNEFPDGGEITGIIGGEVGLILQRNAVRRMAYVGGNLLFRFDKISSNVGCASVHSIAQHGELAFWYSQNGFKMWDGAQIKAIGYEKVDEAFGRLYGLVNLNEMSTAIDGQRSTVCWSTGRKMWLYNWLLDKWTVINHAAQIITSRETKAPGLDEPDPVTGPADEIVESPGLDTFDAARFRTGDPLFYVFTGSDLGTFNGENMAAKLVGRTIEPVEGMDARIRRIRPMTDATSGITVRLATRQRLGDHPVRRDFTTLQRSGEMPVRARGRFVRPRIEIEKEVDWSYLHGLDATIETGGRR